MSGWRDKDPDCERCQNSGFAHVELAGWRSPNAALIECPDCYPHKAYSHWHEIWVRDTEAAKA
jgi:hypothetical protein